MLTEPCMSQLYRTNFAQIRKAQKGKMKRKPKNWTECEIVQYYQYNKITEFCLLSSWLGYDLFTHCCVYSTIRVFPNKKMHAIIVNTLSEHISRCFKPKSINLPTLFKPNNHFLLVLIVNPYKIIIITECSRYKTTGTNDQGTTRLHGTNAQSTAWLGQIFKVQNDWDKCSRYKTPWTNA